MSAKKMRRRFRGQAAGRASPSAGFYTPFCDLPQRLRATSPASMVSCQLAHHAPPGGSRAMTPWEEEELFRVAMQDVIPLNPGGRARIPPSRPQRPQPHFALQEELEAYAQLADWVRGSGSFELVYGDEYVDGGIVGLSPEVLQKLRGGEFSPQDHVDLHGFRYEDAREVVVDFVRRSFAQGLRCVLIVPGRGKNSKDRQPVLKEGLVKWLTRSPLKPIVLAFSSARSHHGGVGAFYVLLRRAPGSVPVVTPAR